MTGGGVHHAIECIGLKATAEQAFQMLAVGGTATVVGMVPFDEKIELHAYALLGERRLQGFDGLQPLPRRHARLIELYLQGRLHLDDWISQRIRLEQINEGFEAMKAGKVIRSIIDFEAA